MIHSIDEIDGRDHDAEDENEAVDDRETTCLLYDAARQQRHWAVERARRESLDVLYSDANGVDADADAVSPIQSPSSSPAPMMNLNRAESMPPVTIAQPQRIQFSDLVRISGGIRSASSAASNTANSITPSPRSQAGLASAVAAQRRSSSPFSPHRLIDSQIQQRRGSLPSSLPPSRSRSRSSLGGTSTASFVSGPSGSVTPLYSSSLTSLPAGGAGGDSSSLIIHHPSPHRPSGLTSRPGSFRSEVSRASTPTSLYAPLLQPSATAPSPTRAFYLTIKRGDGQVSYRDMVKRQMKEDRQRRKVRSRDGRRKRRTSGKGTVGETDLERGLLDANANREVDERSRLVGDDARKQGKRSRKRSRGVGWFCGLCSSGRWRSRSSSRSRSKRFLGTPYEGHEEAANSQDNDASSSFSSTSEDEDDDDDDDPLLSNASLRTRAESKSEMTVLFGSPPWRWFKMGYWRYRLSRLRRDGTGLDYDEEGDGGELYIDGSRSI